MTQLTQYPSSPLFINPASYNQIGGNNTHFGMNMKKLTILHLQGNRISGEIPTMNLAIDASDSVTEDRILPSAYISDCGMPSDLTDGLLCSECTMCCECPLFTS